MRKVILGFKGDPELKWEIVQEAEECEMSVSEYLETIVENRHVKEEVSSLRHQLRELKQERDLYLIQLNEYVDRLEPLLVKYIGKELPFRASNGTVSKMLIRDPKDLLDCILSSLNKES